MTRTTWIGGALAASAAAGPIVVVPLALAGLYAGQEWGWRDFGGMVLVVLFSLPFGFACALICRSGTEWID